MRIFILVLCCVCGSYGENNNGRPERSNIVVTFNVSVIGEHARCISSQRELTLEEGTTVILNASTPILIRNGAYEHIRIIKCTFNNGTGNYELGERYNRRERGNDWREVQVVKNHMFGTWTCKLQYNENGRSGEIVPIEENRSYSYVVCNIIVKKPDDVFVPTTTAAPPEMPMNTRIWYIIGGVGILVLLIIVGQAIALCYFRRKAQPRRRLDSMTNRSRFDRGDRARYSAPPCKKGKSARGQADRDSHIYEMVGVNALYNKSSDLEREVNAATAERTTRGRPPLPLPHGHKATPMTSVPSTLSLNSTSSGSNLISKKGKELPPPPGQGFKKAPARPPKQVDEDSIPGSLRRPAVPLPAPAPASAKTGTSAKKPSAETPMSELKNIFKKRNAGKDTSTSSTAATLERKEPPKVQAKPSTLTKSPKKQPPDATTTAVKPINQTNQIKLILPKIEASLKAPKPLVPKPVEPTTSTVKSPPTLMKKPSQVVPQKPTPLPVTQLAAIPVQKRPLPTPETSRKLPPEPNLPQPLPPLPPLNQASHEDQSPNTSDDDEEWTYEQLGEYNIYNI